MVMPAAARRAWTRTEVVALIDANPLCTPRYELVDGELLVTPSPSGIHQRAVREIMRALASYLEACGAGEVLASPSDVELEPGTLVQPDLYVIPPSEGMRLLANLPPRTLLLAIEVMSPSSGKYDGGSKRAHYHRTVPEYWIIDLDGRSVERWRHRAGRADILRERVEWRPPGVSETFVLELGPLFAKVLGEVP